MHVGGGQRLENRRIRDEPQRLQEVRWQRLGRLLDGLPQIVERHAAAATCQRQVQRATDGKPVPPAGASPFVLLGAHALDEPVQCREGRGCRGARNQLQHGGGVPRQPAVRGFLQVRDRVFHDRALLAERRPDLRCRVVLQAVEDRPDGPGRQRHQRLEGEGSQGRRFGALEGQRGEPIEDARALRQREQPAGGPRRRPADRGRFAGPEGAEDGLDGARIGDRLEREQQAGPRLRTVAGRQRVEQLPDRPGADHRQARDSGVMAGRSRAVWSGQVRHQAADLLTG